MPRKKFSEAKITLAVREFDTGAPVAELCRKLDVSAVTIYDWKRKDAGMGVPEIRRLRQIEEGNAKLKWLVVDLTRDTVIRQDVLSKKW